MTISDVGVSSRKQNEERLKSRKDCRKKKSHMSRVSELMLVESVRGAHENFAVESSCSWVRALISFGYDFGDWVVQEKQFLKMKKYFASREKGRLSADWAWGTLLRRDFKVCFQLYFHQVCSFRHTCRFCAGNARTDLFLPLKCFSLAKFRLFLA